MSNLPHVGGALGRDSQSRPVFSKKGIRGEAAGWLPMKCPFLILGTECKHV